MKLNDDDNTAVAVDVLTFGGVGINVFAGINGDNADRSGLELSDASFALAFFSERAVSKRKWTSLQAGAESIGLVNVPYLDLSVDALSVEYNNAADDGTVIDFALMVEEGTGYSFATGLGDQIDFEMDGTQGAMLQVAGNLDLSVSDFVTLSGDFAIQKTTQEVTLDDGSTVTADIMTIGAEGVSLFAGVNADSANKMGFEVNNADVALALLTDQADSSRSWTAFQSNVDFAGLVGIDSLTLGAAGISVDINTAALDGTVVDFATTEFEIPVSSENTILFDMDTELTRVGIENGTVSLGGFVVLSGGFYFEKATGGYEADINTGLSTDLVNSSRFSGLKTDLELLKDSE